MEFSQDTTDGFSLVRFDCCARLLSVRLRGTGRYGDHHVDPCEALVSYTLADKNAGYEDKWHTRVPFHSLKRIKIRPPWLGTRSGYPGKRAVVETEITEIDGRHMGSWKVSQT